MIFRAIRRSGVDRSARHFQRYETTAHGIVGMLVAAGVSMMKRSPHAKVVAVRDRPGHYSDFRKTSLTVLVDPGIARQRLTQIGYRSFGI
jgi:hypothetical protein